MSIPTRRDALRYVLEELARAFEWGRLYDERDVNAILKGFHEDTARLRRELVDEQVMLREKGRYWLVRPHDMAEDMPGASAAPDQSDERMDTGQP